MIWSVARGVSSGKFSIRRSSSAAASFETGTEAGPPRTSYLPGGASSASSSFEGCPRSTLGLMCRFFLTGVVALFFAAVAHAQSVRWQPGDASMLNVATLVFENCAPDGDPSLPSVPGVTFTFVGQTESVNIVNTRATRTVLLSYLIRARQNGPVQIPAFTVKTDKGLLRVDAYTATPPVAQAQLDSVATSKLVPERTSVWAGEVFGLNYELSASRRTNPQISPTFDWNAAPLVAEDWSKPEVTETMVGGERRLNVVFRTRVVAKTANTLKLEAASHLLSIQTGTYGFGIISQPRMEQVSVTSDQPTLEVRALPTAPAGFSGAVGQFKLTSKIVPEKAAVGEPITWTLELAGTGNWPDIAGLPAREVSNDFRVVQPKAKRTPAEGKLFDVTLIEDVVLMPTKAGTYTLGPLSFVFFDPKTGTYVTRWTERRTVTVSAPVEAKASGPAEAKRVAPEDAAAAAEHRPPAPAATPAGIPRDPLPGTAAVSAPMSGWALVFNLVLPFATLAAFWVWLAVRRAVQTDPVRPRREARDRLAKTLHHLATASDAERPGLLRAWQKDAAILWQVHFAAPRPEDFFDVATASVRSREIPRAAAPASAWATLWAEADRALYGAQAPLPPDWVARAQEALAAAVVPGFRPTRLFLPQNLWPFAAMLMVGLVSVATILHAAVADPAGAYARGDFTAAESAWRQRLKAAPTDWIARHNLSLALAQQERAPEAAAQATAALVQHPTDPAVRWHFAYAAEKAGVVAAPLSGFVTPGPLQSLARLASPAQWQVALIGAAWLAAGGLGHLFFNAYRGRRRGRALIAGLAIAAGVALAGSALSAIASYGVAARADAVIVARAGTLRSIPTEADTTQKTSPLAAGAMAIADKSFLGGNWTRLQFQNGQTGWVRKEDIVPLWK